MRDMLPAGYDFNLTCYKSLADLHFQAKKREANILLIEPTADKLNRG